MKKNLPWSAVGFHGVIGSHIGLLLDDDIESEIRVWNHPVADTWENKVKQNQVFGRLLILGVEVWIYSPKCLLQSPKYMEAISETYTEECDKQHFKMDKSGSNKNKIMKLASSALGQPLHGCQLRPSLWVK